MQPYYEKVKMPDMLFPIRMFINKDLTEKRLNVHPHWHKECEILYIMEGQARQQIGEYFFEVVKGDLIIILSDQLHSTYSIDEKECVILVLQFCPEYFMLSSSTHTYKNHILHLTICFLANPLEQKKDLENNYLF